MTLLHWELYCILYITGKYLSSNLGEVFIISLFDQIRMLIRSIMQMAQIYSLALVSFCTQGMCTSHFNHKSHCTPHFQVHFGGQMGGSVKSIFLSAFCDLVWTHKNYISLTVFFLHVILAFSFTRRFLQKNKQQYHY